MSAVAPEKRLRLLNELAVKVGGESWISINLVWENDHSRAGVYANDEGASVFLNNAQEQIANLEEAEAMLRKIFADEVVSVTGYEREQFVYCQLVPSDALGRGIPTPGLPTAGVDFKVSDSLVVETWSRGVLKEGS